MSTRSRKIMLPPSSRLMLLKNQKLSTVHTLTLKVEAVLPPSAQCKHPGAELKKKVSKVKLSQ
jgi:hypothetical protein